MLTVRRVYLYLVAFISLEVVIWGAVFLGRSIACGGNALCGQATTLALGLAAILVGAPFFLVHWLLAQRFARRDEDERASPIRAVFFYGVLLATLIPIAQNLLAFFDHIALKAARLAATNAMFSSSQTWSDNLIAIGINLLFAAYFFNLLRNEWRSVPSTEALAGTRRLYRYIWLTYSLVLVVAAIDQLLRFILGSAVTALDLPYRPAAAHGMALALVGVPLWAYLTRLIDRSLEQPDERESSLRLGMLYFYSLAGVVTVLTATGEILVILLRLILGEPMSAAAFITRIAGNLAIAVPLGLIWAYYGRQLSQRIAEETDPPRRAGMRRVYAYILSAIGLAAAFVGLGLLVSFLIDAAFGQIVWANALRPRLAAALATLMVGLPLWLLSWLPMQREALQAGDAGDHARRSILRRVYLYLALFAGVIGGMVATVALVNSLLRSLLGLNVPDLLQVTLHNLANMGLFAGLAVYHGLLLRRDGRMAAEALAEKHAAFPVLVFDSGADGFGPAMQQAIAKQTPRLPVALQAAGQMPAPGAAPAAVVLPADLALDPPEPLRAWLAEYPGRRVVVPLGGREGNLPKREWLITGGLRPLAAAAAQAAQALRQLAEGQAVRQGASRSGWVIVAYIAAGFFGLQILIGLIALGINLLGG